MSSRLVRQLAGRIVVPIFGAMLLFAIVQSLTGEAGLVELFLRYLLHSVILTLLIISFLLLWLRSLVLRPLDQMVQHARNMANGGFLKWDYLKVHNEVDQLATTMNEMADDLNKIKQTSWKEHVADTNGHLEHLLSRHDIPQEVKKELSDIRLCLRKMEIAIEGFAESLSDPASQW